MAMAIIWRLTKIALILHRFMTRSVLVEKCRRPPKPRKLTETSDVCAPLYHPICGAFFMVRLYHSFYLCFWFDVAS